MKVHKIISLLLCSLLVMSMTVGCQGGKKGADGDPVGSEAASTELADMDSTQIDDIMMSNLVADVMEDMTLEQKIGQLFIVCTDSLDFHAETEMTDTMQKNLETLQPGGIIFFSFNLENREQITKFITEMQNTAAIPMFMSVDEEGGTVARVANTEGMKTTKFPPMAEIGATGDPEEARKVGETIGKDLSLLGFNLDFAPVADLSTNTENTEIGARSFGSDPALVSDMVSAEVRGLQDEGVSATLKHFPGQGDTGEDTHRGYVNLDTTIDRLRNMEFQPFEAGIKAGTDLIMTSHVAVTNLTQSEVPSSLSPLMVTDILRNELQYDNIIITDAMNMKVITKFYDSAQAAVMALEAGNDMILMPDDFEEAVNGVKEAVDSGELSKKTIDRAVERIIKIKIRRGILPLDSELFSQNSEGE